MEQSGRSWPCLRGIHLKQEQLHPPGGGQVFAWTELRLDLETPPPTSALDLLTTEANLLQPQLPHLYTEHNALLAGLSRLINERQ